MLNRIAVATLAAMVLAGPALAEPAIYSWTGYGLNVPGSGKCPTYKMTIDVTVVGTDVQGRFQQEGRPERNFKATMGADMKFKTTAIVGGGNQMDVVGSLKEGASTIMLDGYCLFEGKLTRIVSPSSWGRVPDGRLALAPRRGSVAGTSARRSGGNAAGRAETVGLVDEETCSDAGSVASLGRGAGPAADPLPAMQETPSLVEQGKSGNLAGRRQAHSPSPDRHAARQRGPGQAGGQLDMLVSAARDTRLMTIYS